MKFRFAALCALLALGVACSGGGNSTPRPAPTTTVPGEGYSGAFSATVAFSIVVPSQAETTTMARRRRAAAASPVPSAPASAAPDISPLVGSIQITDVAVNGSSLAVAQAPKVLSHGCSVAGAGCTLSASVPAAPGVVNRYLFQTYAPASGGAAGAPISSGYVDVDVPSTGSASSTVTGATVSIGGFVASITFSPGNATLAQGVATDLKAILEPIDAAGSVIVGNTFFADPIGVTSSETTSFTIDGRTSLTLVSTLQEQIDVHYDGATSLGTVLEATTTDALGNSVTARLPIAVVVGASPTPSPTPVPTPTTPGSTPKPTAKPTPTPTPTPLPAISLYAIDAQNNDILEYDVVDRLLTDAPVPSPSPRRVVQFDSASLGGGSIVCNEEQSVPAFLGGLLVDASARLLAQSACTDSVSTYVYQFKPTDVGLTVPTVFAKEPVGFVNFGLAAAAGGGVEYFALSDNLNFDIDLYGFSSAGTQKVNYFGDGCQIELGQPAAQTSCPFGSGTYQGSVFALAADASGNPYVGQDYLDNTFTSATPPQPITPPGPGSVTTLYQPPAVSVYAAASGSQPFVLPELDIAGEKTEIGGNANGPSSIAIDGSTLYVLANPTDGSQVQFLNGATAVYAGLSSCPAPSASAPLDGTSIAGSVNCADGNPHSYLVAYDISTVLSVLNFGLDVELTPKFVIGGDTVGKFGDGGPNNSSTQELAAYNGIVAVVNTQQSSSNATGEIDVYATRGVTGSHTNIAPVLVIPNLAPNAGGFLGTVFQTIAIGPSGSATGGASLLLHRNTHLGRYTHHAKPRRFARRR